MSTQKPKVHFTGEPVFREIEYFDWNTNKNLSGEIAHVNALNHPVWNQDKVRTSLIQYKFNDGSFETLNTIYIPLKEQNEH